jgi:inhibitor of KinA
MQDTQLTSRRAATQAFAASGTECIAGTLKLLLTVAAVLMMALMKIVPLGEAAVIAYTTDEDAAVRLADAVRRQAPPWLEDVVPSYASVGVFFDATRQSTSALSEWLTKLRVGTAKLAAGVRHVIPVCYERGPDLARVATLSGLTTDAIIALHASLDYAVHAVGFVPGFPYLGYLPKAIATVPRLDTPRTRVEPGSVGIAGKQTGIYPMAVPGGWMLIGRTPVVVVDVAAGFFPMNVGDRVRFERIDETEFTRRDGERLG